MRINTETINQNADLLALSGQDLKRVSSTCGGEYAGACPFCGGTDRFRVQPEMHRWLCRSCTDGKWQDAIELGRKLHPGSSFAEVCKMLGGGLVHESLAEINPIHYKPADQPPVDEWQEYASRLIAKYESALWSNEGARARKYLNARGIKDESIREFRLGLRIVPRGISIPCIVGDTIWYVKFRNSGSNPKYINLKGSKSNAVFNADSLVSEFDALFVEGEFDCILAWQESKEMIPVASLGSAANTPDLATWGRFLLKPSRTFILADNDEAGAKGASVIANNSRNPVKVSLPGNEAKDLTDFWKGGGDVVGWVQNFLLGAENE